MKRLPYYFQCSLCAITIERPGYDLPTDTDGCEPERAHEWQRCVDARRVAAHEAAHAIAAAVLLGAESVQSIRMERPSATETVYLCDPRNPSALLITLSGAAATARMGDARDGALADLRLFRRLAFGWLSRCIGSEAIDDASRAMALSHSVALMLTACESAADEFVARWEASIDHLADLILNARRLDGLDLANALSDALALGPDGDVAYPVLAPEYPLEVWRRARADVATWGG